MFFVFVFWDKIEECLRVNGWQLIVQVGCNLEARENVLLVQCFVNIIRFMADRVISTAD